MKFIDLFAGIGGFRTGMELNGHECVAFCEIDKYARQSYKAIHNTEGEEELHDITKWTDEHIRQFVQDRGHIDCICGGFPCQSFSVAGKRGGFNDTRGTLFFEIMRIASIIRPQYLFLENVKGLLNHDGGATFETILNTLDEFGYDAEWQVLNSKNFGVPQSRERVFIVGHLRGSSGRSVFPVTGSHQSTDIKYIGNTHPGGRGMSGEVYSLDGLSPTLTAGGGAKMFVQPALRSEHVKCNRCNNQVLISDIKDYPYLCLECDENLFEFETYKDIKNCNFYAKDNIVVSEEVFSKDPFEYDYEYIEPEFRRIGKYYLLINQDGTQAEVLIELKEDVYETVRIISDVDQIMKLEHITPKDETEEFRIRRLTPLESWRLQGFTDEQFYKAKNDGVSNAQLYKQAGNSVTVNVIDAIARKLI